MIKYIAKQVDPDFQGNDLFWRDTFEDNAYTENCFIYGNKKFKSINLETFNLSKNDFECYSREDIIDEVNKKTGDVWDYYEIRGCCQGDWNVLFYKKDMLTQRDIDYIESCYFNTGMEFCVNEKGNLSDVYNIYIPECFYEEIQDAFAHQQQFLHIFYNLLYNFLFPNYL